VGLGGIGVGFERRATGRPWSGSLDGMGVRIHTNATGWPGSAASPVHLVRLKGAEFVVLHGGVDGQHL
jgi:hypothetical protein